MPHRSDKKPFTQWPQTGSQITIIMIIKNSSSVDKSFIANATAGTDSSGGRLALRGVQLAHDSAQERFGSTVPSKSHACECGKGSGRNSSYIDLLEKNRFSRA